MKHSCSQNPAQKPQTYGVPVQESSPKQKDSNAQNTLNFEYNPNTLQNDELGDGCFGGYKIILCIFMILSVLRASEIMSSFKKGYYDDYKIILLIDTTMLFILFVLLIIQLQAMQHHDLTKAKMVLIGFISYLVVNLIYVWCVYDYRKDKYYVHILSDTVWINLFEDGIFVFPTLIGSIQVFRFLKKQKNPFDDEYHNVIDENMTVV